MSSKLKDLQIIFCLILSFPLVSNAAQAEKKLPVVSIHPETQQQAPIHPEVTMNNDTNVVRVDSTAPIDPIKNTQPPKQEFHFKKFDSKIKLFSLRAKHPGNIQKTTSSEQENLARGSRSNYSTTNDAITNQTNNSTVQPLKSTKPVGKPQQQTSSSFTISVATPRDLPFLRALCLDLKYSKISIPVPEHIIDNILETGKDDSCELPAQHWSTLINLKKTLSYWPRKLTYEEIADFKKLSQTQAKTAGANAYAALQYINNQNDIYNGNPVWIPGIYHAALWSLLNKNSRSEQLARGATSDVSTTDNVLAKRESGKTLTNADYELLQLIDAFEKVL